MKRADAITLSVLVAVDPPTAFEVFTDEVDLWWKRGPAYRFRAGADGTMRFESGPGGDGAGGRLVEVYDEATGDAFEVGRVLAWEPPRRLAVEWRGPNFELGQSTRVEVRFEAAAGGTRVTVEHGGWDGLPADHPVRHGLADDAFARMWGDWWLEQMRSMKSRARGRSPRVS